MSEQVHKEFNLYEQKAKDILSAIIAIIPVVSIIRNFGSAEKECERLQSDVVVKTAGEIVSISETIRILDDEDMKKTLSKILLEKQKMYNIAKEKQKHLEEQKRDLLCEIQRYQTYIELFEDWDVDKDLLQDVLELHPFNDEEEFLALLCFILNNRFEVAVSKKVLEKDCFSSRSYSKKLLEKGWNYMFEYLKNN